MSQSSEISRDAQSNAQYSQSAQGVNAQQVLSTQHQQLQQQQLQQQQQQQHQQQQPQQQQQQQQQQQRSSSHAERSGRQRIQRSSSSASSRSSQSASAGANGRAEGLVGTGSHQQYSAEGGFGANNGSFGSAVSGERRQGRYRRQVIRLPDQAQGQVRQVRRRLPTPEPDTLERVYIQRTAGEVVEEITEIPTTPPPRIQERTVVEPAGPPQVVKRTIRVPPRGGGYGGYQQQQQQQQQGVNFQPGGNLLGPGNYGNVQQIPTGYQQQVGATYSGGYGVGTAAPVGAYGPVGGGYQPQQLPQAPIVFSVGGPGSSQPLPPVGCHPAFCFYV